MTQKSELTKITESVSKTVTEKLNDVLGIIPKPLRFEVNVPKKKARRAAPARARQARKASPARRKVAQGVAKAKRVGKSLKRKAKAKMTTAKRKAPRLRLVRGGKGHKRASQSHATKKAA